MIPPQTLSICLPPFFLRFESLTFFNIRLFSRWTKRTQWKETKWSRKLKKQNEQDGKKDSVANETRYFAACFYSSKQGLVIMTLHIIVTIQLYHEGDKNKNLKPPPKILQLVNFRRSLRAVSFLKGEKYLISQKYMAMAAGCFFNNSKTVKFVTIFEHLKLL